MQSRSQHRALLFLLFIIYISQSFAIEYELTIVTWGHSVRVRREEEKGTISWKIKFRNGTEKNFVSPITTKPWGKFIPKLAEGDTPNQGEINSQRLYSEPEGLNTNQELPSVPKNSFKKGVYY